MALITSTLHFSTKMTDANNGYARTDNTTLYNTNTWVGKHSTVARNGFWRFTDVYIPKGAIITSAIIRLRANATESVTTCKALIKVDDQDNAGALSNYADWLGRGWWATTVAWNPVAAMSSGSSYSSPDISTLVQHIVDRAGWVEGNAVLFTIVDDGSTNSAERTFGATGVDGIQYSACLDVTFQVENTWYGQPMAQADAFQRWGVNEYTASSNTIIWGVHDTDEYYNFAIRFPSCQIPKGSKILTTTLKEFCSLTGSSNITSDLYFNNVDDASMPTNDITFDALALTTAKVSTALTADTTIYNWYETSSDFITPLQEVINRASYVAGNDVMIIGKGTGVATVSSRQNFYGTHTMSHAMARYYFAPKIKVTWSSWRRRSKIFMY